MWEKHHETFIYEHVGMDCIFVQSREELEYMRAVEVLLNTSKQSRVTQSIIRTI